MGFLLWIIAASLYIFLFPFAVIASCMHYFYKRKFFKAFKAINRDAYITALSIDQTGNTTFKHLFNKTLIKRDGYSFGNPDETISGVLGKNKKLKTLSSLGRILDGLLEFLDKGHTINAIEE